MLFQIVCEVALWCAALHLATLLSAACQTELDGNSWAGVQSLKADLNAYLGFCCPPCMWLSVKKAFDGS